MTDVFGQGLWHLVSANYEAHFPVKILKFLFTLGMISNLLAETLSALFL